MTTLSEKVTHTLRNWILGGRFLPGQRIEEIPMAAQLCVSRTPVRAALAALANEGLIDHQPKRGYTVRSFDLEDVMAAYQVRSVLEGLACRTAALKGLNEEQVYTLKKCLDLGDEILSKMQLLPEDHAPYQAMNAKLHSVFIEAANNSWLKRFTHQTQQIPYASDWFVLWDVDHAVIQHSHEDHHRIVKAVIEKDPYRADTLMREHVYYASVIMKNHYAQLIEKNNN